MIKTILSILFTMSLRGSFVILAVLLLRLAFRRAPKIFSYVLWSAVLLRLLCPFSVESDFSALGFGRQAFERLGASAAIGVPASDAGMASEPSMAGGAARLLNETQGQMPAYAPAAAGRGGVLEALEESAVSEKEYLIGKGADRALFSLWLIGMAAFLIYTLCCDLKLSAFLKSAVRQTENIYVRSGIPTPFVRGVCLPKIYLPTGLSEKEAQYMLMHEKIHIRRGDALFRRLAFLALMIHWFNPLVWLAFFLSERDMEMSCDEAVLKIMGSSIKKEYSGSLLRVSQDTDVRLGFPLAFGEKNTKKRITNILSYRKMATGFLTICVCLLAVALAMLITNPKETSAEDEISAQKEPVLHDGQTEAGRYAADGDTVDGLMDENAGAFQDSTNDDAFHPSMAKNDDSVTNYAQSGQAPINDSFEALIGVKSISRSARVIERYQGLTDLDGIEAIDEAAFMGGEPAFAEDCKYYVNPSWMKLHEEEINFDSFVNYFKGVDEKLVQTCRILVSGGLIREIRLLSTSYDKGLSYAEYKMPPVSPYEECKELYGEDMLERCYKQVRKLEADIADVPGMESIEVYAGNGGDGNSGLVLFKSEDGEVLYSEWAHEARAGWNSIYHGKLDGAGADYILTLQLDNHDDSGAYVYHVYRLDASGMPVQMEGGLFEWGGPGTVYEAERLAEWCHMLEHKTGDAQLLLSTQDGEIRTEPAKDVERYTYQKLRPERYPDPYEGKDIR